MNNTAIIILAAGNSSRFGSAKQLLRVNNKTLLKHVIDEAVESGAELIVVVTGANAKEIEKDIQQQVQIVRNENWKEGMATGIIAGVKKTITLNNDIEKIIITVCDQPFVSAGLFKQLYQAQEQDVKYIVASSYADTIGTPALFTQKYFDALMDLPGDEGAKKILKANADDVATVDFPQGAIDIDTPKDYEDLLDKQKHVL